MVGGAYAVVNASLANDALGGASCALFAQRFSGSVSVWRRLWGFLAETSLNLLIKNDLTERTGFEPADQLPGHGFSKPALSTTQPPLRGNANNTAARATTDPGRRLRSRRRRNSRQSASHCKGAYCRDSHGVWNLWLPPRHPLGSGMAAKGS